MNDGRVRGKHNVQRLAHCNVLSRGESTNTGLDYWTGIFWFSGNLIFHSFVKGGIILLKTNALLSPQKGVLFQT